MAATEKSEIPESMLESMILVFFLPQDMVAV
jgi:hypothetical protein